jgi:hypothetical protein
MNRGASSASWIFIPKSTMLATNWACAWGWFPPPMMPNPMCTSPFSMNAGIIEWNGRILGFRALGLAGSRE